MSQVYSQFKEQAVKNPDKVAIQHNQKCYTYTEMLNATKHIAKKITESGTRKGDFVAVYMNNSVEAVVSILSVLSIGAVCIPIDGRTPDFRLEHIMYNSKAQLMLHNNLPSYMVPIDRQIKVNLESIDFQNHSGFEPEADIQDGDIAFCIYTSGSTGIPKGVLIPYQGILNHIKAKCDLLGITRDSVLCQSLSLGFVAVIWQLLAPLVNSAKVVLYDEKVFFNIYDFLQRADEDGVKAVSLVPQMLNSYLQMIKGGRQKIDFQKLEYILLTGEKVEASIVNAFYCAHDVQLVNAYGLSECSDDIYHYVIPKNSRHTGIPIGKPIENISCCILDEDMVPVPKGSKGELAVSGICLAKGYLYDAPYTADKFVVNPFDEGVRLFKTGDIVMELEDGNIQYIGRKDNQVKIRGHRIELEEIESYINQITGIIHAIVIANTINAVDKMLEVLYMSKTEITAVEFTDNLSRKLPSYMVPAKYTRVKEFSFTSSGKVDRTKVYESIEQEKVPEPLRAQQISADEEKVFEMIKSCLDPKLSAKTELDTSLSAAGVDSVTFINIIVALEEAFDIIFEDDMLLLTPYSTVRSLVEYVGSK